MVSSDGTLPLYSTTQFQTILRLFSDVGLFYFLVYLTTLSVAHDIIASNDGFVNNELKGTRKETIVA
jgi:hypothetical protein